MHGLLLFCATLKAGKDGSGLEIMKGEVYFGLPNHSSLVLRFEHLVGGNLLKLVLSCFLCVIICFSIFSPQNISHVKCFNLEQLSLPVQHFLRPLSWSSVQISFASDPQIAEVRGQLEDDSHSPTTS